MEVKKLTTLIQNATPFIKLLDIKILKADGDGYVELEMPIKPEFTQDLGHAHGGAIGTLADFAANLAIRQPTVTVEYKINFIAPGAGDKLFATAETIKHGRQLSIVQSNIYAVADEKRTLVATCIATLIPANPN